MIMLLLLALPFIEIALFIVVGDAIGVLATLALVVLTALLGIGLIQRQGLAHVATLQRSMQRGERPVEGILNTLCTVLAGILLVIPGFLTDVVGLVLLIPGAGLILGGMLIRAGGGRIRGAQMRRSSGTRHTSHADTAPEADSAPGTAPDVVETRVIDVSFEDIDRGDSPPNPPGKH
jgi:UPF0716 protein FxsA